MTCGIYKIKNIKNGKFYIGSSQNIENRWKRHIRELCNGNHHNMYLQRAWIKYGKVNFSLVIVKKCYKKTLIRREQKILDELFDSGVLYNISPCASGGDILSTHPEKEAIVAKIKANSNKVASELTAQERKEKWGKSGKDNPNYGNRWNNKQKKAASKRMKKRLSNPKARAKISTARVEYFKNPENRAKMSELAKTRTGKKNPFYGKRHSEETKEKIRAKNKGKYLGNQEKPVVIDGVKYKSVSCASRHLNIHPATVIYRIKSKNPKFSGYKYVRKQS